MHLPSLANIGVTQRCHSIIPMCQRACSGNFELDACQRMLLHWSRRVHKLACKHMICLRACALQTMICLQADQQELQGLQKYFMFASMWLTKISCVCKPHTIIPFLFVRLMATRVVGNKEGNGEGGKGNGDSNKVVRQGTVMATKRAMATVVRVVGEEESKSSKGDGNDNKVVGNKEGDGKGSKKDSDSDKDGGRAMGMMAMAMATTQAIHGDKVAGNKEGNGEGSKSNDSGNEDGRQQRGQWQGW
jgi:hypothetical protein